MSFRKFLVEFRAAWFLAIEYRISVFIWIIAIVLPLIMLAAWLSIAQNGSVGNFDRGAFISYYLAAVIVRNMTGVWFIWVSTTDGSAPQWSSSSTTFCGLRIFALLPKTVRSAG